MDGREEVDVDVEEEEPLRLCGRRCGLAFGVVVVEGTGEGEEELLAETDDDDDGFGEPLFRLREIELGGGGALWPL